MMTQSQSVFCKMYMVVYLLHSVCNFVEEAYIQKQNEYNNLKTTSGTKLILMALLCFLKRKLTAIGS